MGKRWTINLGGTNIVYSDEEWMAIKKENRTHLLVKHKGSRFQYV